MPLITPRNGRHKADAMTDDFDKSEMRSLVVCCLTSSWRIFSKKSPIRGRKSVIGESFLLQRTI